MAVSTPRLGMTALQHGAFPWKGVLLGKAVVGMEIAREIDAFLAVAEELHFGRVAARQHLTTSRVSKAIRGLE